MDEKGFLIKILLKLKRIFLKDIWEKASLIGAGQDNNRE